jgi:hypothetical protein
MLQRREILVIDKRPTGGNTRREFAIQFVHASSTGGIMQSQRRGRHTARKNT